MREFPPPNGIQPLGFQCLKGKLLQDDLCNTFLGTSLVLLEKDSAIKPELQQSGKGLPSYTSM
jgi:hypothetical protein